MDRGAWRATVHGTAKSCRKESGTTKRLSTPLGLYLQLKTVLSALLSHTSYSFTCSEARAVTPPSQLGATR